ncbi:hypothetical protein KC727_02035 [Candidatus Kaiserbacteria bacterium]|nr:hypothetical protein [Candidatus Kaiserbacteria bacterium]
MSQSTVVWTTYTAHGMEGAEVYRRDDGYLFVRTLFVSGKFNVTIRLNTQNVGTLFAVPEDEIDARVRDYRLETIRTRTGMSDLELVPK